MILDYNYIDIGKWKYICTEHTIADITTTALDKVAHRYFTGLPLKVNTRTITGAVNEDFFYQCV